MGYGRQALKLLQLYYEGKMPNLEETNKVPTPKAAQAEVYVLPVFCCLLCLSYTASIIFFIL